jgi:hypothetical protein
VPCDGKWPLGNPDGLADETDGARVGLPLPSAPRRAARVYQKDPRDARWGFGAGAEAQEGVGAMRKKQMGSSIDDFLKEEGILEEAQAQAVKEVVAWQLAEAMKKKKFRRTKWPRCWRPAARKSTGSSVQETTSSCRVCNERRQWWAVASQSS